MTAAPYSVQTCGIYVDTAGRVGIGTTAPGAKIHADWTGGVGVFAGDLAPFGIALFQTNIATPATTHAWFSEDGDCGFNVTAGGKVFVANRVGIGTSNPQTALHVVGGARADDFSCPNPTNASANVALNWRNNVARIRVGGSGTGSGSGFDIQGPGDVSLLRVNGDGTIQTRAVTITGADLAEKFPVTGPVQPGMVVAIDPNQPGQLCLAAGSYNRCVAGIVSGANGLPAGAVMGNLPGHEDAPPIALSGRVWCYCDASNGSIQPGDLLTTSDTPGHAMKATDSTKAHGAILGKAMTSLEEGRGLVLVLVSLQ